MKGLIPDSNRDLYSAYQITGANSGIEAGGTCLIVRYRSSLFVVTARHCVDRGFAEPAKDSGLPSLLKIKGFRGAGWNQVQPTSDMEFYLDDWYFGEFDNDIAVARIAGYNEEPIYIWHTSLNTPNQVYHGGIGADILFCGYPKDISAYEAGHPSLIVRNGVLASHPQIDIEVPNKLGRHYGLIDAYSQNGFSGSPIWMSISRRFNISDEFRRLVRTISGQKMQAFSSDDVFLAGAPERHLVGINCGHFKTFSDRSSGEHAGLSYYVRVERVRETFRKCVGEDHLEPSVSGSMMNQSIDNIR